MIVVLEAAGDSFEIYAGEEGEDGSDWGFLVSPCDSRWRIAQHFAERGNAIEDEVMFALDMAGVGIE